MKKFLSIIGLALMMSCGGSHPQAPSCEDRELVCEYAAWRAGDIILEYIQAQDCAFDFGSCIAKRKGDCQNDCYFAAFPKECQDQCYSLTGTSTVGGK